MHELLKARFRMIRQDLDQALDRLTDADMTWRPAVGMRTVGDLLLEIANKETETLGWIRTGVWPDDAPDNFDPDTSTLDQIRAVLADNRVETYAFLDGMTEAELRMPIGSPEGWWEALRLTACPLDEIIRNIAAHEWYHTGQLVTYLWMRGDDPYNWAK
jgi:uncharacterized damage-inducible protein DinB